MARTIPVEREDDGAEEKRRLEEEVRLQREEEKELRKIQLEEARAKQAERQRAGQEKIYAAQEEASKEEEERSYNKSFKGRILNKVGKGKYQKLKSSDEEEQASGKGGSTFSPTLLIEKLNNPHFWSWVLGIFVFLFVAWWTNFLRFRDILYTFGFTILGLITVVFMAFFILYGWVTSRRDIAKFYIATALFIWMLDLVPENFFLIGKWLGPAYQGFEFPFKSVQQVWEMNWLPIIASSFTFAFLYINMVYKIIKKEYLAFLLSFGFIILFNYLSNQLPTYLSFGFTIPYGKIIFITLLIFFGWLAWKADKKRTGSEIPEFFTCLYMIFVFSFFWLNTGWQGNIRAWFHTLFIIAFGFGYIKPKEGNQALAHILIPTLLLVDFFGYGFLYRSDVLALQFIPPLVIFVIFFCYDRETKEGTKNYTYPAAAFIFLITFILLMSVSVAGTTGAEVPFVAKGGIDYKQFFSAVGDKLKDFVEGQLSYATGGYYSQVEKNQFEPLGVFFDRVKAAQPRFYTDEDVTLWATIKSRTLSDPVTINFTCFRWKDSKRYSIAKEDKVYPPNPFTVYTLEDKDVECTFTPDPNNPKLQAGTNTVTLSATYNFATSAYQKVYFIDRDRQRAMIRENLDPLKEFGIPSTERKPAAIYTNGPVEIAVDVQYLITVADESGVNPALGIMLKNRDKITDKQGKPVGEWQGKIKKINELVIVLPKGITIDETSCRPVKFDKIYNTEQFCTSSCLHVIYFPCIEKCEKFERDSNEKQNCIQDCSRLSENVEADKKCSEECSYLFKGDQNEPNYVGYKLNIDELNKRTKDEYKDIDKFKTFLCRIVPTKDVLENVPITTKFIRVKAKYDYLLEKSYSVTVEQAPIPINYTPYTYTPSNTDIDAYLQTKNSPLKGIGQCIKDAEQRTGVPAIVMLGVIGQENSYATNPISVISKPPFNNIFSIQCTDAYIKYRCSFADKSQCCATSGSRNYNWRKYQDYCESVNDFPNFLSDNPRYATALQNKGDPEKMVLELVKARYAEEGSQWSNGVIAAMKETQTKVASLRITPTGTTS